MKKIFLALIIALSICSLTALAQYSGAPAINVSLINQDPDPVTPGRYVDLRFIIQNNNPESLAENFEVMLDPIYPFSLDENENPARNIGDLQGTGGKNVVIVKYKVRVDENAIQGENPIKIKFRHDTYEWVSKEVNVNVRTVDANLGIVEVKTNPEKIEPGEKATLMVIVQNMADSTMNDITLKLDLTFSRFLDRLTTVAAADSIIAFNTLPFAPVDSTTEKKIYSLAAGQKHVFTYELIAFTDAKIGVYKIPVEISYYDELQEKYTKNDIIGLVVSASPELSVILDQSELYAGKRSGDISIRFVNRGFTDIKFLNVKLLESDEYEILSSHEVYVGNVDSDDYETTEFSIYMKNNGNQEKQVILPLEVEYRDDNNVQYKEEYDLKLNLYSPEKLGQKQGNSFGLIVLVIIAAGIIYFFYRRRKHNKK